MEITLSELRDHLDRMEMWLSDGDETWIGIFQNMDKADSRAGNIVAFPFKERYYNQVVVGITMAPEMPKLGIDWRYIMIAKVREPIEAIEAVFGADMATMLKEAKSDDA